MWKKSDESVAKTTSFVYERETCEGEMLAYSMLVLWYLRSTQIWIIWRFLLGMAVILPTFSTIKGPSLHFYFFFTRMLFGGLSLHASPWNQRLHSRSFMGASTVAWGESFPNTGKTDMPCGRLATHSECTKCIVDLQAADWVEQYKGNTKEFFGQSGGSFPEESCFKLAW